MEIQYFLQSLGFYLLPSLLVALIPAAIIITVTLLVKSPSRWMPIFLCVVAGIFMWCNLMYWSMQGFFIAPFGTKLPMLLTNLLAILSGIVGGAVLYLGTINYQKNNRLMGLSLIGIGYFIFVFIVFSILSHRGVA